jgi:hypothetical protein
MEDDREDASLSCDLCGHKMAVIVALASSSALLIGGVTGLLGFRVFWGEKACLLALFRRGDVTEEIDVNDVDERLLLLVSSLSSLELVSYPASVGSKRLCLSETISLLKLLLSLLVRSSDCAVSPV